jgi:hypothetical protein
LAKQPADLHSLEMALFSAREIAEELGDVVVVYFIDMSIAEVKMKSPPTANDHKPRTRKQSRISRKNKDIQSRISRAFTV